MALYAAAGISEPMIAREIGICQNTLRKHFADELREGNERELARNLRRLSKAADAGNVAAIKHLDAKLSARSAQKAWAEDDQPERTAKPASKREAQLAAAEAAVAPASSDWGNDLLPDGVVKFPATKKA